MKKKNLGCHNFKNVIQFQVECSGIIRTFTSNKFITGMQLDVCQHSIIYFDHLGPSFCLLAHTTFAIWQTHFITEAHNFVIKCLGHYSRFDDNSSSRSQEKIIW